MHFVKFHPEVASCLLSRGKRKYAPLGMRLLWKYIRNYFLVYHLISHFLLYLQNYKEFEAEILDLQSEKYGLSSDIKKYTTSGWALGDENVIGIRAFNLQNYEIVIGIISVYSINRCTEALQPNTCLYYWGFSSIFESWNSFRIASLALNQAWSILTGTTFKQWSDQPLHRIYILKRRTIRFVGAGLFMIIPQHFVMYMECHSVLLRIYIMKSW